MECQHCKARTVQLDYDLVMTCLNQPPVTDRPYKSFQKERDNSILPFIRNSKGWGTDNKDLKSDYEMRSAKTAGRKGWGHDPSQGCRCWSMMFWVCWSSREYELGGWVGGWGWPSCRLPHGVEYSCWVKFVSHQETVNWVLLAICFSLWQEGHWVILTNNVPLLLMPPVLYLLFRRTP